MSEEKVEIVRKALDAYNAFARGELSREAAAEFLDPQMEFHWHDERKLLDIRQHLRGVPAFMSAGEQMRSVWGAPGS